MADKSVLSLFEYSCLEYFFELLFGSGIESAQVKVREGVLLFELEKGLFVFGSSQKFVLVYFILQIQALINLRGALGMFRKVYPSSLILLLAS